jgi:hypothetical protein
MFQQSWWLIMVLFLLAPVLAHLLFAHVMAIPPSILSRNLEENQHLFQSVPMVWEPPSHPLPQTLGLTL